MPAIQVARTDTFEIQRQKINQIGDQIFNISQGGSDLSTGNLKLGNGTKIAPSLSFITQENLGLYKVDAGVIGFVGQSKKIADFSITQVVSYKDFIVQQNILTDSGVSVLTTGSNYDAGLYTPVTLTGGTGDGATAEITVVEFGGTITNSGLNYSEGTFTNVSLSGGTGTGATAGFTVEGIIGTIVGGSNYVPNSYTNVPLTGGSGTGAEATIVVTGDVDLAGTISNAGTGYSDHTSTSVTLLNVPTQTFVVTTITNPGTPPPDNVYAIDGNTQPTLTLTQGNTYRFDLSDASVIGHPFTFAEGFGQPLNTDQFIEIQKGTPGTAGAFIDLIVKPNATLATDYQYYCAVHGGMGNTFSVVAGSAGVYGHGFTALVTSSSGNVTAFDVNVGANANGYKVGDNVSFFTPDLGQGATGSGFVFNITGLTYLGSVTGVQITDPGQNYVKTDVLSASAADIGGAGAGFTYTVTSDPGVVKNFEFSSRGTGYAVSDVLGLPSGLSGVATTIPGRKQGVSTTLSTASAQITVSSTVGIVAGMNVIGNQTNVGQVAIGTTVASVDNATTLTLSANPTVDGAATLEFVSATLNQITVADTTGVVAGDIITIASGTAILDGTTTVSNVIDGTTLEFTPIATQAGTGTVNIRPTFGVGTTPFAFTIDALGIVDDVEIVSGGNGYDTGDVLSVSPSDLAQPIVKVVTVAATEILTFASGQEPAAGALVIGDTLEDPNAAQGIPLPVVAITTVGGVITAVTVKGASLNANDTVIKTGVPGNVYTIDSETSLGNKYYIDGALTPDLTIYSGDVYDFDISDGSLSSHPFALSIHPDGSNTTVADVSTTFSVSSADITVASSTGILVGMSVTKVSGDGDLLAGTTVEAVNGNTITLSNNPLVAGATVVTFSGVEYTTGVTRTADKLSLKVIDTTPNLYYYCQAHPDMGGADGVEALLTVNTTNPRVFGSGFQLSVAQISSSDVVSIDADTGSVTSLSTTSGDASFTTTTVTGTLTAPAITGDVASINTINASNGLVVETNSESQFKGNLKIGPTNLTLSTTGDITSLGVVRCNGTFSSNGKILISENEIETTAGNDLILQPFSSRIAKIDTDTALVIPVGDTNARPLTGGLAQNGSIRFNTDSNQYEGYNATTTSWSSLGGVRDIDGNTYILAELTAGANDNTLWFYNDGVNSAKLTTHYLDFTSVKKISSTKVGLPSYTDWIANTAVTVGQYIKYRNNLYEVTGAGTTGTTGSEPTHTSGAQNNGTAQLTWSQIAVGPLTFENVEEVRIGPSKDCPLIIGQELKLNDNIVSTTVKDLILKPNAGKQTIVDSVTHFRIPAGTDNEKSIAAAGPGSIRFNTTIQQFEGYSGTNWSSLGGVRDVDGNTYIIPETAPAANENILYFYNNNVNTLQLTETALDFTNIDTVTTSGGNSLAVETAIFTLNSNDTTIDNTSVTSTFISSTKQYLDLGLSSGLNTDPILRLDDQGDVYLNRTFGSGTFNGVKIFDGDLKEFELADYKVSTSTFALTKGGLESSNVVLYPSGASKGCKVTVVSKSSSGKRSMTEYSVIDNGTDIFHNEYASLNTSADQYTASFDFTASTEPRITLTLTNDHATSDIINFTVLVQEIK